MTHPDDRDFEFVPPPPRSGDPLAEPYLAGLVEGELRLQECMDCGRLQHPPRPICRRCASFDLSFRRLSGRGVIVGIAHQFETMDPFSEGDLIFQQAVVELIEQDGLQLLTKLVTPQNRSASVGMRVIADFLSSTSGDPALVFRPVRGAPAEPDSTGATG